MDTIRWGMIGCGSVTEVKSGPGFQKAEGSSLVAVMRRNGALAEDYARRHKVKRWYDDADKLINDPEVDAIYIATHPDSHKDYVIRAAKAGKPIYCEKPLGRTFEDSQAMVEFCNARTILLFSAYYRRALPKYLHIKKLLEEGKLGDIRFVNLLMYQTIKEDDRNPSWRVNPAVSGGGRFLDVGSHSLDLLDWYLGPIEKAQGQSANQAQVNKAEDIVSGSWVHTNGVHGTGIWCFNAFKDEDSITIYGSKGKLSFSVLDIGAPITLTTDDKVETLAVPTPPEHVAQPMIQTVVNQLLGKEICLSTGESAMRTDWVMKQLQGK
ncbi:putative dehydrogenase [Sphaerochaeta pleomorpha str. Grapes]|uniref:Putative dehydrogenase n=1 Tax=Sphaerochaeta pleomorpha (strain ATCC BAA-1885 / DSM 22778 / Grapes) TaxID=158190 RepID=G8QQB7_SPHPG|nr:Gfo/Idh/MocA family oxidoreductase [Sphaerochaeta pleomorpha]AEV29762.1 putative dehydrogenase [Sphaerochaeta pleomorpha str. Grapes]